MRGLVELLLIGLMAATPERAGAAPIIDAPTVLQRSPAAIQATLGRPVRIKEVPSGDVHLPDGGTSRVHDGRGTRIDVDLEKERRRPSAPLDRRRVDYDRRHKEARHPAIGWNKEE